MTALRTAEAGNRRLQRKSQLSAVESELTGSELP
jgi:hypothetical protein